MYIKNVTADDFYTKIYDNKNYNFKCKKLDKFSLNVYDENKNFGLSENCDINSFWND